MSETIAAIVAAHRAKRTTPEETIRRTFARIRAHDDAGIFTALRPEMEVVAEACLVAARAADLPLLGVPVAVKDNIDVEGLPTTAGCPGFGYEPEEDATVVARLKRAGAVIIGKTSLDQFSAGSSGTRMARPPRNALDPRLVPGGSSAGSAVAVAAGLVPLAIGTDTAGGGRVPAALNNIVGLKPSLGLVSTAGLVPACRSLDCVSLFALTVEDAWIALQTVAGRDPADPYTRVHPLGVPGAMPRGLKLGTPKPAQRVFFGDAAAASAYDTALARLAALGATVVEIDFEPFWRAAHLMRESPLSAERYLAARRIIESSPQALDPITREVLLGGARKSAVEAFTAFHELAALRRACERRFREIDALALPTVPTVYSVEQVRADPIELDARLGVYGAFANVLDLCALAVPASLRKDNAPFGLMLAAPAGRDALLASIGRAFHASAGLPLGGGNSPHPPLAALPEPVATHEVTVALAAARIPGLALEEELRTRGGRFLERTMTRPDYRLLALSEEGASGKGEPALVRAGADKGRAIEVDLWALPVEAFGAFVATVADPLTVGTLMLADGRTAATVFTDAHAVKGASDVSRFGSWNAYLAAELEKPEKKQKPETEERPAPPKPAPKPQHAAGKKPGAKSPKGEHAAKPVKATKATPTKPAKAGKSTGKTATKPSARTTAPKASAKAAPPASAPKEGAEEPAPRKDTARKSNAGAARPAKPPSPEPKPRGSRLVIQFPASESPDDTPEE
ncbi:MAG TPA: allophanate hydrolase [Xanthobacteraceae bacterium]|nr:allophanate hydrolase [Xanthobacteraceae bacterium]